MIAAALTTPFDRSAEVDLGGVRALVEHVIDGGIPAVFVAGTNGEFPALDDGERLDVISTALETAGPDGAAVYVYVFTALAGTVVPPSLLGKLATIDGIVGVKVSGAGADVVRAYSDATPPGFEVWSGNDAELPGVMVAGGTGIVSGNAGALPGLFARLLTGYSAQPAVQSAVETVRGSIADIKHLLDLQGRPSGRCRMAIDPPDAERRAALASLL